MHSVCWWSTLLTVWSSCPEIVKMSWRALTAHQTQISVSWRGSSWISLGFFPLQFGVFWKFTSHVMKTRPHKKKQNVHQFLDHVQAEETITKMYYWKMDHVCSKHELPLPNVVAVVTVLWPFAQMSSKCSSPELRFSVTISSRLMFEVQLHYEGVERKEASYSDQTQDIFNILPTKLNTLLSPLL